MIFRAVTDTLFAYGGEELSIPLVKAQRAAATCEDAAPTSPRCDAGPCCRMQASYVAPLLVGVLKIAFKHG